MEKLVLALDGVLQQARAMGLKLFVHNADGMVFSLVVAPTEDEARRKVLDAQPGRHWDEEKDSVTEIDGGVL